MMLDSRSQSRWHLPVAVLTGLIVLLAACAAPEPEAEPDPEVESDPEAEPEGEAEPSAEVRTVTVGGATATLDNAIYLFMEDFCTEQGYGIQVEARDVGPRFLDRVVLADAKDIDVVQGGYSTIPPVLELGLSVIAFSGQAHGTSDLLVSSEHEVSSWEDLRGLRIGLPTGSLVEHQVLVGLDAAGVGPDEFETEVMFPGPAATVALVRGDLDAIGGWETWPSTVVTEQLGYIPFDYMDTEIGPIVGLHQTHADNIGEWWLEEFTACFVEAAEIFNMDQALAVEYMREWSGVSEAVAVHGLHRIHYDPNIYLPNLQTYARIVYEFELVETDTSGFAEDGVDYSVLEAVTGLSADELGRTTRATVQDMPDRDPAVYDYTWRPGEEPHAQTTLNR